MSTPKHTAEPWKVRDEAHSGTWTSDLIIVDPAAEGRDQQLAFVSRVGDDKERQRANARRIAACVNACAGIPTEALENDALRRLLDVAEHAVGDTAFARYLQAAVSACEAAGLTAEALEAGAIPALAAVIRAYVASHDEDERELAEDAGITPSPCDCDLCRTARATLQRLEAPDA